MNDSIFCLCWSVLATSFLLFVCINIPPPALVWMWAPNSAPELFTALDPIGCLNSHMSLLCRGRSRKTIYDEEGRNWGLGECRKGSSIFRSVKSSRVEETSWCGKFATLPLPFTIFIVCLITWIRRVCGIDTRRLCNLRIFRLVGIVIHQAYNVTSGAGIII